MTVRFDNLELLKGQSLVLVSQLERLFDEDQKKLWRSFVDANIIQEFVALDSDGDPIRIATEGQIMKFFKVCCEKGLSAEDFLTENNTEETGIKIQVLIDEAQTPHIDKVSLKRFILSRNATNGTTEDVVDSEISAVTVGEVEESIPSLVPADQVEMAELLVGAAEEPENTVSDNEETVVTNNNSETETTQTATVVTRAEEPTIFEILHLDPVFVEILDEMGANFTYGGVEYGKLSIKEIANMMAAGVLPKFKNYRVATSEEIKLFLLSSDGNIYNLPEGVVELILERCKARSKRTTGKWAQKKRGEEVPAETVVMTVPTVETTAPVIAEEENHEENQNVSANTPNAEELKEMIYERLTSLTNDAEDIAKLQNILSML